jgi:hypothetical protein
MAKKLSTRKLLHMAKFDTVVVAWAESVDGPGWSNTLVWVIVRDGITGKLRQEALQPSEQTADMFAVFAFSDLATARLTSAVRNALKTGGR